MNKQKFCSSDATKKVPVWLIRYEKVEVLLCISLLHLIIYIIILTDFYYLFHIFPNISYKLQSMCCFKHDAEKSRTPLIVHSGSAIILTGVITINFADDFIQQRNAVSVTDPWNNRLTLEPMSFQLVLQPTKMTFRHKSAFKVLFKMCSGSSWQSDILKACKWDKDGFQVCFLSESLWMFRKKHVLNISFLLWSHMC